jgi:hypothetical protein
MAVAVTVKRVEQVLSLNLAVNQICNFIESLTAEIKQSIVGINDIAKVTFDSSKKNTNRSQQLSNVAISLNKSVEVFKL